MYGPDSMILVLAEVRPEIVDVMHRFAFNLTCAEQRILLDDVEATSPLKDEVMCGVLGQLSTVQLSIKNELQTDHISLAYLEMLTLQHFLRDALERVNNLVENLESTKRTMHDALDT